MSDVEEQSKGLFIQPVQGGNVASLHFAILYKRYKHRMVGRCSAFKLAAEVATKIIILRVFKNFKNFKWCSSARPRVPCGLERSIIDTQLNVTPLLTECSV